MIHNHLATLEDKEYQIRNPPKIWRLKPKPEPIEEPRSKSQLSKKTDDADEKPKEEPKQKKDEEEK